MTSPSEPRISVVIPTYQRREIVTATIEAFERQVDAPCFEVVVVVDGSNDGTLAAVEALNPSFPLRVAYHDNRGLPYTRNRGASLATGEIVLFIDDDMEPHERLLAEHVAQHDDGADAVQGSMPLHPDSPDNLLSRGAGRWADGVAERLEQPGYKPKWYDLFGGQISIARRHLDSIGGFEETFGSNEDQEFWLRVLDAGLDVRFHRPAITWQRFVVTPEQQLEQYWRGGRFDVELVRMHPHTADSVFRRINRSTTVLGPIVLRAPRLIRRLVGPARRWSCRRIAAGHHDQVTAKAFFYSRAVEYWNGVADAGGVPDGLERAG